MNANRGLTKPFWPIPGVADCQPGEPLHTARWLRDFNSTMGEEFGHGFFDNPVLMMLLELFEAKTSERQVSVKALALSSGVPASTAQRWIDRMEAQGLVVKRINKLDRRSAFVDIEGDIYERMVPLLSGLPRIARNH